MNLFLFYKENERILMSVTKMKKDASAANLFISLNNLVFHGLIAHILRGLVVGLP